MKVFAIAALAVSASAHGSYARCAQEELSLNERSSISKLLFNQLALEDKHIANFKAADEIVVPTYIHVVNTGESVAEGNVAEEAIAKQIEVMNAGFASSNVKFALEGVTRSTNAEWAVNAMDDKVWRNMSLSLRQGGPETLNMYAVPKLTTADGQGLLGVAVFPSEYRRNPETDGVRLIGGSFPGGAAKPYDLGKTATHEVGHWMGLYHVFQGGCFGFGDEVRDTPASKVNYGCPAKGTDSCKLRQGTDDFSNFMDYVDDGCMDHFTPGQSKRMRAAWKMFRA